MPRPRLSIPVAFEAALTQLLKARGLEIVNLRWVSKFGVHVVYREATDVYGVLEAAVDPSAPPEVPAPPEVRRWTPENLADAIYDRVAELLDAAPPPSS